MATSALEQEVRRYQQAGFVVTDRTEASVQLLRKKKFSLVWFFLLLGIFYLPWYIAKRDDMVVLELQDDGKVKRRGSRAGRWR